MEGEIITHAFDNSFHANFPSEFPELSDYKMNPQPSSPSRIYAGGVKPVCYRFDSEEQWDEVNPFKVEDTEL